MGSFKNKMILVAIGAVALHLIFAVAFVLQKSGSYNDNKRKIDELKEEHRREDDLRKDDQEKQLTEKYGTTKADRIAFDPRLDIQQTLAKLFYEVLPVQFETTVTIERFSDFNILIKAMNLPDRALLAGYLKEVFSRVDPAFVGQLVFTDGDHYFVITRDQLTRVRDWKNAENSEVFSCCLKD